MLLISKEKLAQIGQYILDGLKEDEACIMCDVDPAHLKDQKESDAPTKKFLQKQRIRFKLAHLKEIQTKKSEKNSQWLLENVMPEEFGKNKDQPNVPINIISQLIQNIQNGEQSSRIAPRNREELEIARREQADNRGNLLEVGSFLN